MPHLRTLINLSPPSEQRGPSDTSTHVSSTAPGDNG